MKISSRFSFIGLLMLLFLSGGVGVSSAGDTANKNTVIIVPSIDGVLSDGEWDDANSVDISIRSDWIVTVFYKHDGSNIYVAFKNLKKGSEERYPEILLDVDNDKSSSWQQDDWWLHISYNDCEGNGEYNTYTFGDTGSCKPEHNGWTANNFPLDNNGIVETQISFSKIGLMTVEGKTIGITFDVTDTWPSDAQIDNPSTWGTWDVSGSTPTAPVPDIKANGSDGAVTINTDDEPALLMSINAGVNAGQNVDWWVVYQTSSGEWNYYNLSASWLPGLFATYQGPLFDLDSYAVNVSGLTTGSYTFYFEVDTVMNGSVDSDSGQLYYDSVIVNVK